MFNWHDINMLLIKIVSLNVSNFPMLYVKIESSNYFLLLYFQFFEAKVFIFKKISEKFYLK